MGSRYAAVAVHAWPAGPEHLQAQLMCDSHAGAQASVGMSIL